MAGKTDPRRKPTRNSKLDKLAPVKFMKVGIIDYKDVATLRKFAYLVLRGNDPSSIEKSRSK